MLSAKNKKLTIPMRPMGALSGICSLTEQPLSDRVTAWTPSSPVHQEDYTDVLSATPSVRQKGNILAIFNWDYIFTALCPP